MSEHIYLLQGDGVLESLEESPFALEDALQSLIADHPELLAGDQMRPDDPLRWVLITREKGIADKPDAGDRWSVDHLILDQDARPTLVEVKRGRNPEIRRTIVGQMLEYAAHAQRVWTAEELRQTFEERSEQRGSDPTIELAVLLASDTEPDADAFWEQAATNLSAGRLRLLFVSDDIPDELERVVTFLNEQMPTIEVLAVEVKRFVGPSSQTLVPRVLGRLSAVQKRTSSRSTLTAETFLEQYASAKHREVVERILRVVQAADGDVSYGSTGISIRVECAPWRHRHITVAWLFPPGASGWMGLHNISIGEAISDYYPEELEGELKDRIEQWISECAALPFGSPINKKGTRGATFDYGAAADNIEDLERMLRTIISELASLPP